MSNGILQGSYARTPCPPLRSIRLLNWNIERGLRLPGITDLISREAPDLCLFQEVDFNAKRTGKRYVADILAARFQFNFAFGVEFEELSQGDRDDPALHGQAVLSRGAIREPRILRFSRQSHVWDPRWYLPRWQVFQARRGGRMALAAEVTWGDSRLVVYNVHLESRGDDALRLAQLNEVVHDSFRYPPDVPVVVAGDLNTFRAPSLFRVYMQHNGFQDACAGAICTPTKANGETRDWIFIRGAVTCSDTRVHNDVRASDHYPMSTTLTLGA